MHVVIEIDGEEHDLYLVREGDVVKVEVDGQTFEVTLGQEGAVTIGDRTHKIAIGESAVTVDGHTVPVRVAEFHSGGAPGAHGGGARRAAKVKPPMPGKIVKVAVREGDEVDAGALLVVLEAMKMQNEITAPGAATVTKVHVREGQNVDVKDVLVELA